MGLRLAFVRTIGIIAIPCALVVFFVFPVEGQIPDGPYFGQTPPGLVPEIFAPDIVSFADRREDKIAFSADGQQCALGVRFITEYTRQENGHWLPWDGSLFGTFAREPFFALDGSRLFLVVASEIFMSEYDGASWSAQVRLPSPINLGSTGQWVPMTTIDGTLYFASNRDGHGIDPPDLAIYRAPLVDGAYPVVEKLGPEINGQYGAADPYVAPDKSYMVFGSDRPEGQGEMDFYMTFAAPDGSWTEPKPLGPPINTPAIEFAPYVSPDGNYLFFSRPVGFDTPNDPSDILWVDSSILFETQGCCHPGQSCDELDPRVCAAAGGTPAGRNNSCLGDGNNDGFDDVCVPVCDADPPLAETISESATKNRYISLTPTNAGVLTALRVTFVDLPDDYAIWNGRSMWVTNPSDVTEQSGSSASGPAPTFKVASLSCTQDCRDWGALGLIDVFGEAIIPGAQYQVQAIECVCDPLDEGNYSLLLSLATSRYGDVVDQFDSSSCQWKPPDGVVSIPFDTVSEVEKFRNISCTPRKARMDLIGVPPNSACVDQIIGVSDYVQTLDAFRGALYPFSPSAPDPCDAAPCPGP